MRPGLAVMGVAALCAAGTSNACTRVCTLIACQDQFSATVRRSDGTFPSGMHQIDVVADGVSFSCTFSFPLPTLPDYGTEAPACPAGLLVSVVAAKTCTDVNGARTCTDIPGQYDEEISLIGTPAEVQVQQSVDGALILDVSASPTYQEFAPNGAECGPVCHQASVDWTLQ